MWKKESLKSCRTVEQLVAELQKLPPKAKLIERTRPVYFNTGRQAKEMGLKPEVGFMND